MKVRFLDSFLKELNDQVNYIAKDKPSAARKFKNELIAKFKNLETYPLMYKKSIYFNREDIRDMPFKGYTVVYKIEAKNVLVFALVKHQDTL